MTKNKEKHEKAFEAWVNQFKDQIPGTKCMIQKELATLRYAWGAACEYMWQQSVSKALTDEIKLQKEVIEKLEKVISNQARELRGRRDYES